jgi:putative transposase
VQTTESGGPRGYDTGKKIRGRKRHIVTDTQGKLVGLVVHDAGVQDRDRSGRFIPGSGASLPIAAVLGETKFVR